MKPLASCVVATWFVLLAAAVQAATQSDKPAAEPTVGIGWVVLFVLVFIGLCVFIGVAAVRAERKNKSVAKE